jgi:hypothetical protein
LSEKHHKDVKTQKRKKRNPFDSLQVSVYKKMDGERRKTEESKMEEWIKKKRTAGSFYLRNSARPLELLDDG